MAGTGKDDTYAVLRERMVAEQIRRRGITDPQVLSAMRSVPRHCFVPPEMCAVAYEDYPLSIGHGQTISQPYIVAYMLDALELSGETRRVLEIGTGSGYQTALLAHQGHAIYTVERIAALMHTAQARLEQCGYTGLHFLSGDGYGGWPANAPYDRIVVSAAPPAVPEPLIDQLAVDGIMVLPVGTASQTVLRIRKTPRGIRSESLLAVQFVPLVEGARE